VILLHCCSVRVVATSGHSIAFMARVVITSHAYVRLLISILIVLTNFIIFLLSSSVCAFPSLSGPWNTLSITLVSFGWSRSSVSVMLLAFWTVMLAGDCSIVLRVHQPCSHLKSTSHQKDFVGLRAPPVALMRPSGMVWLAWVLAMISLAS